MNTYLLAIDCSNNIFKSSASNEEYVYTIKNPLNVNTGDQFAVYIGDPIKEVRMIIEASRDSSDGNIYYKKIVDVSRGVKVEDIDNLLDYVDKAALSSSGVIELDEIIFEDIIDGLSVIITETLISHDDLKSAFKLFITYVLGLKNTRQVRELESLSNRLESASVISRGVYSVSDVEEYRRFVQIIKNSKEYLDFKAEKKAKNPQSGLPCDQGMTNYEKFLIYRSGLEDNSPIPTTSKSFPNPVTGYQPDEYFPRNRIFFGAPGTGKSWELNKEREKLLKALKDPGKNYERVTFHPDYSYASFVGTYKPIMVKCGDSDYDNADLEKTISVIKDESKSLQDRYELLYPEFAKRDKSGLLSLLLGFYSDESFKSKKKDGTYYENATNEQNYGKAIRKYFKPIDYKCDESISYEFVPGPFLRVLVEALKNAQTKKPLPYLLIIEEINRANVAAVFGDVFQLLDRGNDNASMYPIHVSEDVRNYLSDELKCSPDECSSLRIPDNMFIWATMNSADQGVFPMDTAFKRRWDFEYLGIDTGESKIIDKSFAVGGETYNWNCLRKAINDVLAENKVNEDKLMGPFFLSPSVFEKDNEAITELICSKVLMYLFEDAAKQKREYVFSGSAPLRYSSIRNDFMDKGIKVFVEGIQDKYSEYYDKSN